MILESNKSSPNDGNIDMHHQNRVKEELNSNPAEHWQLKQWKVNMAVKNSELIGKLQVQQLQ